jgi:glycosyltransferase involved in cell wall biosynthesis
MNPKISIVIPSYNQGRFLDQTIKSVLDQNYSPLEIFIIDGGSTDNTIDVIRKYESGLTGWVMEKDNGQSDAINKGFKKCTGEIVTWLCSDDLYTPGALQKVADAFQKLPADTGLIHGNSEIFLGDNVVNYDKGYGAWPIERQLSGMTFPQPSAFFRKTTLDRAGLLNERLHFGMDYDLFARMRMITNFHYVDFFFSRYRLHNESKSTIAIGKFIDEWMIVFNSIVKALNYDNVLKVLVDRGLERTAEKGIYDFFKVNKPKEEINRDKMLFYFIVNVIRYDYATGEFERVRKLGAFLKSDYGEYLRTEPTILKIIRRSFILSPMLLRLARKFKRSLTTQ